MPRRRTTDVVPTDFAPGAMAALDARASPAHAIARATHPHGLAVISEMP